MVNVIAYASSRMFLLPLFNFLKYIYILFNAFKQVLKWAVIIGQKLPSNSYSLPGSHVNVLQENKCYKCKVMWHQEPFEQNKFYDA